MSVPLLISADDAIIETVLAAGAAVQVNPLVARDSERIRRHWAGARVVLVGVDQAAALAALGLPRRRGVHLCGGDSRELLAWSVPLEAPALLLPDQSGFVRSLLDARAELDRDRARLIRVIGGCGGVGATTLAAGLAQRGQARGLRAVLVELDPAGGGIDLLFGAEQLPGWRWPDLASATGHVGDLGGQLPNSSGVDLVSLGRSSRSSADLRQVGGLPRPEAVRAVLAALTRSHDLVVLDAGAHPETDPGPLASTIVCVAAEVKAVVAARSKVLSLGLGDARIAVRTGPGRHLDPELIGETLGLACCGVVPHDPRLPVALETGVPPGRGRRRFARACDRILHQLLAESAADR